VVVSIILLVCLVLFYKLRITIEEETLCASFGSGIIRKKVRLAEIVGCEAIRIR
jgi:protein-S-isoprenylcysteine O-methyltransferase Ste14